MSNTPIVNVDEDELLHTSEDEDACKVDETDDDVFVEAQTTTANGEPKSRPTEKSISGTLKGLQISTAEQPDKKSIKKTFSKAERKAFHEARLINRIHDKGVSKTEMNTDNPNLRTEKLSTSGGTKRGSTSSPLPTEPPLKKRMPETVRQLDFTKTVFSVIRADHDAAMQYSDYVGLKAVLEIEILAERQTAVRIEECRFISGGRGRFICADSNSAEWIKTKLQKILGGTYEGVDPSQVPELNLTRLWCWIAGNAPASQEFLEALKTQNPGLECQKWRWRKPIPSQKGPPGHTIFVDADSNSMKVLEEELKFRPYFGLRRLDLRRTKAAPQGGEVEATDAATE